MTNMTRPIRLALLVSRMDVGGVPDHVMTLIDGFSDQIDVTLICDSIHEDHKAEADRLGVTVIIMPMKRLIGGASDLASFRMLRNLMRKGSFDILHTHMSKAALLGALVGLTNRNVIVVNTGHNFGYIAMPQIWKKAIFWAYDRFISSFAHDATVAVSQTVADMALSGHLIPRKRLHVIQNGVRLSRFEAANPPPEGLKAELLGPSYSDGPLILCVARLVWFKGLHTLVSALPAIASAHPDARVLVVGDGELREELVRQARDMGVENTIVFVGERNDVPDLLRIADLFVLPSVSEGMPISILEAMANRLPVVATNVGGIPELVRDGETGELVPSGDPHSLARAVIELLSNPDRMQAAGAAARTRLETHFSQEIMVAKTEKLYQNLLERSGRI